MRKAALIALTMALAPPIAHAADKELPALSAGELNDFCTTKGGAGNCDGYIWGFSDALIFVSPPVYCLRPSVSSGQIGVVVRQYLAAHPEMWDLDAADVLAKALRQTFPCPKARRHK